MAYWRAFAYTDFDNTAVSATTVIWHVLQAISEVFISGMSVLFFLFDVGPSSHCTTVTSPSISHTGAFEIPYWLQEVGQSRALLHASCHSAWTLCRNMVLRRNGNMVFATKIHYLRVV